MRTSDYSAILHGVAPPGAALPDIYHAVRRIPYGRTGQRDPKAVVENNVGSCSGKHILLRDLLRAAELDAEIITIFTHFNRGIPFNASYPQALKELLQVGEIPDFHHYVRVRTNDGWLSLDATWHDALSPFDFPVNKAWDGKGNTKLAATPLRIYPDVTDLAAFKEQLLASLQVDERERRAHFFTVLTDWIAGLK